MAQSAPEMGIAAGGRMAQRIYSDPYGLNTWDTQQRGALFIHLLNSEQYLQVTGRIAPPTPVSADAYTRHGLPWFSLYDEGEPAVSAPERLRQVRSLREMEQERGLLVEAAEPSVEIGDDQVRVLRHGGPGPPPPGAAPAGESGAQTEGRAPAP